MNAMYVKNQIGKAAGIGTLALLLLGFASSTLAAHPAGKNRGAAMRERIAIEKKAESESVSAETKAVKEQSQKRRTGRDRLMHPARR